MRRAMWQACCAGMALLAMTAGEPVVAPTPIGYPTAYAGLCREFEGSNAERARARIRHEQRAMIAARTRMVQSLSSSSGAVRVTVLTVQAHYIAGRFTGERDLVRIDSATGKRFLLVDIDADGAVRRTNPATEGDAVPAYVFAQGFAAYMYLNQLLADEGTDHRTSCAEEAQAELSSAPALASELARAFDVGRVPSREVAERVNTAYKAFLATEPFGDEPKALLSDLRRQLGTSPPIQVYYRDENDLTDTEIVIVRLGTQQSHAYVLVRTALHEGRSTVGVAPVCLYGDTRCSKYYAWP